MASAQAEWACFFCKSINTEVADSCDFCGNVQPPASWVEEHEKQMKENRESAKRQAAARKALAAKEAKEGKARAAGGARGSGAARAREYAHDGPRAPSKARVVVPTDRRDAASGERNFTKEQLQKHVLGMLTSYLDEKPEARGKALASDTAKMTKIAEGIVARCFDDNVDQIVRGGKKSGGPRLPGEVWQKWFDSTYDADGEETETRPPFWAALFCGMLDDADRRAFVVAFSLWVMTMWYLYFFYIAISRSGGVLAPGGGRGDLTGRAPVGGGAYPPNGGAATAPALDEYEYDDSF